MYTYVGSRTSDFFNRRAIGRTSIVATLFWAQETPKYPHNVSVKSPLNYTVMPSNVSEPDQQNLPEDDHAMICDRHTSLSPSNSSFFENKPCI